MKLCARVVRFSMVRLSENGGSRSLLSTSTNANMPVPIRELPSPFNAAQMTSDYHATGTARVVSAALVTIHDDLSGMLAVVPVGWRPHRT